MKNRYSYFNVLIPVLFLILFFYTPVAIIIFRTLTIEEGFSLKAIIDLLSVKWQQRVIIFTLKQAFYSALLTIAFAMPLAWIFGKYDFYGKKFLKSVFLIPFILPGITVALGFMLFYGNSGFLNQFLSRFNLNVRVLYSLKAILLAHIFYNIPVAIRIIGNTLEKFNIRLEQAAKTLGANRFNLFLRLYLPCLLPSIINSFVLIFIYCFMTFGIVLVLGDVSYTTIEVNIFVLIRQLINFRAGMALGFIQIMISVIFLSVARFVQNKQDFFHSYILEEKVYKKPLFRSFNDFKNIAHILKLVYFLIFLLFVIAPIASVFIFFIKSAINFDVFYQNFNLFIMDPIIASTKFKVIFNSAILGLMSSLISVTLALMLSFGIHKKKWLKNLEILAILPMGISSVTFGLGFLLFLNYISISRFVLLIFAHSVISFPIVFKIIYEGISQLKSNVMLAAKSLGANDFYVFYKISLPLLKNNIFNALMFAFAISLGELGAVSILQRNYVTIPLAIYRYISARNFISATGMSLILIITATLIFYISEFLKEKVDTYK